MTDQALIGPITINSTHLYDGLTINPTNPHKFRLVTTQEEANRIMDMGGKITRFESEDRRLIAGKSPWNPVWLDASTPMVYNSAQTIRGWYVLGNVVINDELGPDYAEIEVEAEQISPHEMEILRMNYTTGVGDDTFVDYGYAYPTQTTYYLDDAFTTFDTTNTWYPIVTTGMYAGYSFGASGGKIEMVGRANTYKKGGIMATQSRTRFSPPYTIKFDTEWVARPASGHPAHAVEFFLSPTYYGSGSAVMSKYNSLRFSHVVGPSTNNYNVVKRDTKGKDVTYKSGTSNATVYNWQIDMNASGYITVRLDTGGGSNTIWQGNLGLTTYNNLYLGFGMWTPDNASKTTKTSFAQVYTTYGDEFRNVNCLPVTTKLVTASDFTRTSEDGNIPCYLNETLPLKFQITPADLYKGSVKAYSSNFPDSTERLLTGTNTKLAANKFYVKNGLVKLNVTASGVELGYWTSGSSYTTLNTFTKGGNSWDLIKLNYVSPDLVVFQTDLLTWYVPRGKPYVYLEHPNQDVSYTLKTCYGHDTVTTSDPGANADITMESLWYTGVWSHGSGSCASPSPADNIRLLILQEEPTTIKSDKIPACNLTGLGYYDNTKISTDADYFYNIAKEWVYRTNHQINIS